MAQPLDVERLLATGRQLTESGRSRAVRLRADLVEQGRQTTDQISAVIDKLVNPVGRNREEHLDEVVLADQSEDLRDMIRDIVRNEVERQIRALDLVTKDDLAAMGHALLDDLRELERRFAPLMTAGSPLQVTPPHQRPAT